MSPGNKFSLFTFIWECLDFLFIPKVFYFTVYKILVLHALMEKIYTSSFLLQGFQWEISCPSNWFSSIVRMSFFSDWFKDLFYLSVVFRSLSYNLCVDFVGIILFVICSVSRICTVMPLAKFRKFSAILF